MARSILRPDSRGFFFNSLHAFDDLGLNLNREVPLAKLGEECIRMEVFFGGPDAGTQRTTEHLLDADRHVHRRASIRVSVVERVRMADHAARHSTPLPVARAVADGEVNFVALLAGIRLRFLAMFRSMTACSTSSGRTETPFTVTGSSVAPNPAFTMPTHASWSRRQRQLPGELANSFLGDTLGRRYSQWLGVLGVDEGRASPGLGKIDGFGSGLRGHFLQLPPRNCWLGLAYSAKTVEML